MSFLNNNNSEFLSSRITRKGRKYISEGNFVIKYFQIGDSEFDYNFSGYTGAGSIPYQKVLSPMDNDQQVKYPYQLSSSSTVTYGDPVRQSYIDTIKNVMGPAGFVSQYFEYDTVACTGTTVECTTQEIPMTEIDGGSIITVPSGTSFNNCEYITITFKTRFVGADDVISGASQSLIYKIVSISGNDITLDRVMPNLSASGGYAQVICNKCKLEYPIDTEVSPACSPSPVSNLSQHDPWGLELVWTQKPAGLDYGGIDESLYGYTGTKYASTKEYLGYTTSSGQTFTNMTGGTITNPTAFVNSFGESVNVTPEDQRCIAIVHFSELGDIVNDPERFYKYDDYIAHESTDIDDFEVYIPFIKYHRNTGTTIGALFTIDTTDYYVSSRKNLKPNSNNVKFRYLIDEQGVRVGKVFVDKKLIVFDDQELVAILDYKSNRRWTLPAPRATVTSKDVPCSLSVDPLILTGQTAWVTYMFEYTGTTGIDGMHCNYYNKVTGTSASNISFRFETNAFRNMSNSAYTSGYIANKMYALVQVIPTGNQPTPGNWKIIDVTDQISRHTMGSLINPSNLYGYQFVVTGDDFNSASYYDIEDYLGLFPDTQNTIALDVANTSPEFGDSQPFPGSIRLTRATDVAVLNYMINLPSTQFRTSQNPTYVTGNPRITEIALLNEAKEALIIAKTAKPVERTGTQVFSVRLDF